MSKIEVNDSYFADLEAPVPALSARPQLPSLASDTSVVAAATTALSKPVLDPHSIIDTREGHHVISSPSSGSRPVTLQNEDHMETTHHGKSIQYPDLLWAKDATTDEFVLRTTDELNSMDSDLQMKYFLTRPKHFLILSSAGKPIYARYGSEQIVSGYMGIFQAIMGFYLDAEDPDCLQSFSANGFQATFVVKGPVYLIALSRLGESETILRRQLEFLYDVVVSSATSTSMSRLFEKGSNFDLRRLLDGTEVFMHRICDGLSYGPLHLGVLLNALSVFRLRSTLRKRVNSILASKRPNSGSLLYGLIAVDKKLVSVIRPKEHSLYPSDLRLLFETVYTRNFQEGQDFWLPLCLPKFNSTGYLHVFVSFIAAGTAIILLSADKDTFFELQATKNEICRKFEEEHLLRDIIKAKHTQVSLDLLSISNIVEHFTFKSRPRVQYIAPEVTGQVPFNELMRMHASLQSSASLRHRYQIIDFPARMSLNGEVQDVVIQGLSWITQSFELTMIARPCLKSDSAHVARLIGAANIVHSFTRKEEHRIWVDDGVTF